MRLGSEWQMEDGEARAQRVTHRVWRSFAICILPDSHHDARVEDIDLSTHPNDGYFKAVFSDPKHAALFFQSHLPRDIVEHAEWATLALVPGSFVKQSLQQAHSDLLFTVTVSGRETLLYLLFEHQTTVDPTMPLRVLGYVLEILQTYHKQNGLPLPPVLPFVLHQGPERWTVSPEFSDLFDLPTDLAAALLPYLPKFRHALLDLSQSDPARDETHDELRLVMQLMKLARTKDVAGFLKWFNTEAQRRGWQVSQSLILLSYTYVLHADTAIDLDQIARSLEYTTQHKEPIMSLAQRLKAEGRIEALIEGRSEGILLGVARTKVQMLERMLQQPVTSEEAIAALSLVELEQRFIELDAEYTERFKSR